jgi:hypothetical protein
MKLLIASPRVSNMTLQLRDGNPFFTREIRQWSRRRLRTLFGGLGCTGALVIVLLVVITIRLSPDSRHSPLPVAVGTMVSFHAILCALAGAVGGDRIFADEHRHSTLEAALLLPYSAPRWLALKLVFPLFLVALAWGAALPLYVMGRYLELGSLSFLLQLSLLPLLAGAGVLGAVMLLPPDYQDRLQPDEAGKARRRSEAGRDRRFRGLLLWLLVYLAFFGVWRGLLWWAETLPFYTIRATSLLLQGLVLIPLCAASFVSAVAAVRRDERSERRALLLRLAAFASICVVGVGLYWAWMSLRARWGVLAALGALALWELRPERGWREDPLARREIAWMEAKWDNPVFVRDVRAYIRRTPIRRSLLNEAVTWLLAVGVLVLFERGRAAGFARSSLSHTGGVMVVSWLRMMTEPGGRMAQVWKREKDQQFLSQLSLTPLRSGEIIEGRRLAALVYVWSSRSVSLSAILGLMFWLWGRSWGVGLLLFGLIVGTFWASVGASLSSGRPPSD